jgi:hypothetical protein
MFGLRPPNKTTNVHCRGTSPGLQSDRILKSTLPHPEVASHVVV